MTFGQQTSAGVHPVLTVVGPADASAHRADRHPERPERIDAVASGIDDLHLADALEQGGHAAGRRRGPGPGPRTCLPRAAPRPLSVRWWGPRPRHLRHGELLGGGPARRRVRARGHRPAPGSRRHRPGGGTAARPPRPGRSGHGLLPAQQRRRDGPGPRRPGRTGGHRRLGRPPRQWDPGHLLERPEGALCLDAPVAVLSGDRTGQRGGRPAGGGLDRQSPATAGDDRRRRAGRLRPGGRSGHRVLPADMGARLGRIRRPPGRPAGRAGPLGRRLRPPGNVGGRPCAPRTPGAPPGGRLRPSGPAFVGGGHPGRFARRHCDRRTTHGRGAGDGQVDEILARRRVALDEME